MRLYHSPEGCLNSCCQGASYRVQAKPPGQNWEPTLGRRSQPPKANKIAGRGAGQMGFLIQLRELLRVSPEFSESLSLSFSQWVWDGHKQDWCTMQTPARMDHILRVSLLVNNVSGICLLEEKHFKSGERSSLVLQGPKALKEKVIKFKIWSVESARGSTSFTWRVFWRLYRK